MREECPHGCFKTVLRHTARRAGRQRAVADDAAAITGTTSLLVFYVKYKGLVGSEVPGEHVRHIAIAQRGRQ